MAVKYYSDEKKETLDHSLFDNALKVAKSFFDSQGNKISGSQLRKFYDEVKSLEKKIGKIGWNSVFPLMKMLKSKILYATAPTKINKKEKEVYNNFKNFIIENIDSIKDEKDFKAFCLYFEAVVGYYFGEGGR